MKHSGCQNSAETLISVSYVFRNSFAHSALHVLKEGWPVMLTRQKKHEWFSVPWGQNTIRAEFNPIELIPRISGCLAVLFDKNKLRAHVG